MDAVIALLDVGLCQQCAKERHGRVHAVDDQLAESARRVGGKSIRTRLDAGNIESAVRACRRPILATVFGELKIGLVVGENQRGASRQALNGSLRVIRGVRPIAGRVDREIAVGSVERARIEDRLAAIRIADGATMIRIFLNITLILLTFCACYFENIYLLFWPPRVNDATIITFRAQQAFNYDQKKALSLNRQKAYSKYIPVFRYIPERVEKARKKLKAVSNEFSVYKAVKGRGSENLVIYLEERLGEPHDVFSSRA